jgi:hypothetical protein
MSNYYNILTPKMKKIKPSLIEPSLRSLDLPQEFRTLFRQRCIYKHARTQLKPRRLA